MKTVILSFLLLITGISFAQTGTISGTCIDYNTKEPAIFINIALIDQQKVVVKGVQTDVDGKFSFTAVNPGDYSLKVAAVGYKEVIYSVNVKSGQVTFIEVNLHEERILLD